MIRPGRAALLAAGAVALALTPASAQAASAHDAAAHDAAAQAGTSRAVTAVRAAPSSCVIDGYTPAKLVVGTVPVKLVFDVRVHGCRPAQWVILAGQFAAFDTQTRLTVSPQSLTNTDAGTLPASVAVLGADENPNDPKAGVSRKLTFSMVRRATWGTSFNAGPEPVRAGARISIKGTLGRVDWNGAKKIRYAGYAARTVQLQFRASGATTWTPVRSVLTGRAGTVSTSVIAVRTGSWRLHFGGNSVTSSADSLADRVVVNPR
jgi:hypothetical protein